MKRHGIAFVAMWMLSVVVSTATADAGRLRPRQAAQVFLEALQAENLATMSALVADDVHLSQPLTLTPQPSEFIGRAAVEAYIGLVMNAFSSIRFTSLQFTESRDERVVFAQMNGEFVVAASGNAYNNTYVMRLDFQVNAQGEYKIVAITEYFNPIILACSLSSTFAAFCASIGR